MQRFEEKAIIDQTIASSTPAQQQEFAPLESPVVFDIDLSPECTKFCYDRNNHYFGQLTPTLIYAIKLRSPWEIDFFDLALNKTIKVTGGSPHCLDRAYSTTIGDNKRVVVCATDCHINSYNEKTQHIDVETIDLSAIKYKSYVNGDNRSLKVFPDRCHVAINYFNEKIVIVNTKTKKFFSVDLPTTHPIEYFMVGSQNQIIIFFRDKTKKQTADHYQVIELDLEKQCAIRSESFPFNTILLDRWIVGGKQLSKDVYLITTRHFAYGGTQSTLCYARVSADQSMQLSEEISTLSGDTFSHVFDENVFAYQDYEHNTHIIDLANPGKYDSFRLGYYDKFIFEYGDRTIGFGSKTILAMPSPVPTSQLTPLLRSVLTKDTAGIVLSYLTKQIDTSMIPSALQDRIESISVLNKPSLLASISYVGRTFPFRVTPEKFDKDTNEMLKNLQLGKTFMPRHNLFQCCEELILRLKSEEEFTENDRKAFQVKFNSLVENNRFLSGKKRETGSLFTSMDETIQARMKLFSQTQTKKLTAEKHPSLEDTRLVTASRMISQ